MAAWGNEGWGEGTWAVALTHSHEQTHIYTVEANEVGLVGFTWLVRLEPFGWD